MLTPKPYAALVATCDLFIFPRPRSALQVVGHAFCPSLDPRQVRPDGDTAPPEIAHMQDFEKSEPSSNFSTNSPPARSASLSAHQRGWALDSKCKRTEGRCTEPPVPDAEFTRHVGHLKLETVEHFTCRSPQRFRLPTYPPDLRSGLPHIGRPLGLGAATVPVF